jgi:hypothetical protein
VKESSVTNFGLVIAFLLPGFVALWGIAYVLEPVRMWFGGPVAEAPSVGGFLYVTLASVAAGLTVSTVRWLLVDTIHYWTGVTRPTWDFARLQDNAAAFDVLNESHYRYYQFYANMSVAVSFANFMRHLFGLADPWSWTAIDALVATLLVVFFVGSRDTLTKYYRRGSQLLAKRR